MHDWEAYVLSEHEEDVQDNEEDYFGSYLVRQEVRNKLSKSDQMAWDQLSGFEKWTIISLTCKSILKTYDNRQNQVNLNEIINDGDEQYVDAAQEVQD